MLFMKYFKILILIFFLLTLISCKNQQTQTNIVDIVDIEIEDNSEIFYDIEIFKSYEFNNTINNIPKNNAYVGILKNNEKYTSVSQVTSELDQHSMYIYEIHVNSDINNVRTILLENIANSSIPYFIVELGSDFDNNYNFLQLLLEKTEYYNYDVFYELNENENLKNKEIQQLNNLIVNSRNKNNLVRSVTIEDITDVNKNFDGLWISLNISINDQTDIKYVENILNVITNTYASTPIILKLNIANFDKERYSHLTNNTINNINIIYSEIIKNYPLISGVIYLDTETDKYNYSLNNGNFKIVDSYKQNKSDDYYLKNILNIEYYKIGDIFYNKTNLTGIVVDDVFYMLKEDIINNEISYNINISIEIDSSTYFAVEYDKLYIKNKRVYINGV